MDALAFNILVRGLQSRVLGSQDSWFYSLRSTVGCAVHHTQCSAINAFQPTYPSHPSHPLQAHEALHPRITNPTLLAYTKSQQRIINAPQPSFVSSTQKSGVSKQERSTDSDMRSSRSDLVITSSGIQTNLAPTRSVRKSCDFLIRVLDVHVAIPVSQTSTRSTYLELLIPSRFPEEQRDRVKFSKSLRLQSKENRGRHCCFGVDRLLKPKRLVFSLISLIV